MREYLLKNVCHEIKEIISLEINIKSLCIALYLFFATLICYAMKFMLNCILPNDYNNPNDIFSTILDPHSLFLYCAIASSTMIISILFDIIKVPRFIRLGINETDVILPVLSIFYMCFIMSVISCFVGKYKYHYIFYLFIIVFINVIIRIYRNTKRDIIDKTHPKYRRIRHIIISLILSISMVVLFLKDVNISSSCS